MRKNDRDAIISDTFSLYGQHSTTLVKHSLACVVGPMDTHILVTYTNIHGKCQYDEYRRTLEGSHSLIP